MSAYKEHTDAKSSWSKVMFIKIWLHDERLLIQERRCSEGGPQCGRMHHTSKP